MKKKIRKLKQQLRSQRDYFLKRMRMKISALWDRELPAPSIAEKQKVEDFRTIVRGFQIPEDQFLATDADRMWNRFKREMRDYILENDPRTFLRCRSIIKSISVPDSPYGYKELGYLRSRKDWDSRWKVGIEEDAWGHPHPYWCYPKSSGTRIHHAYHLALFEEMTGVKFSDHSTFIEFGGGYGNMPRLMNKLGYQGRYLIFDFPEFSALQHFYLEGLEMSHGDLDQWSCEECHQCTVSEWSDLAEAMKKVDLTDSLFMATWSLSEAPFVIREPMLKAVQGVKSILIAFQSHFEDLANVDYFNDYQKGHPEYDWVLLSIEHIPGHYYLFGTRR